MGDKEIIVEMSKESGDVFEKFGFPRLWSEVWMILYLKGDMTQDELKKELGCSLSAISQALSILERLGSVQILKKIGRKNVYSAQDSVKKTMKKRMENINRYLIEPMADLLLDKESNIQNKELKAKIINLNKKFSRMQKMLSLVSKFHNDD